MFKINSFSKLGDFMFCNKCGNEFDNNFQFCPKCGEKINTEKNGNEEFYAFWILGIVFCILQYFYDYYCVVSVTALVFSCIGFYKSKEIRGFWMVISIICITFAAISVLLNVILMLDCL